MDRIGLRWLLCLSVFFALPAYGQNIMFRSVSELRQYGRPKALKDTGNRIIPASILVNNRQIIYTWEPELTDADDGMMKIRPDAQRGGWMQATGNTAIPARGLARAGDTFYVDPSIARQASLDSLKQQVSNWQSTSMSSSQAVAIVQNNSASKDTLSGFVKRGELNAFPDTTDFRQFGDFVEGEVATKASIAYAEGLSQAVRYQDSVEISGKQPLGNYLTSESDPIWISQRSQYLKTADTTNKWQPKGSYLVTETDPIWNAQKANYITTSVATATFKPIGYVPAWAEIAGKPTFSTVATTGSYADLSGKPTIPTVPANVSAFSNDAGYLTAVPSTYMRYVDTANLSARIDSKQPAGAYLTSVPNIYLKYTDTIGKWLTKATADLLYKPIGYAPAWSEVTGKPTLFSGSYVDLTNKPTYAAVASTGSYNSLIDRPTLFSGAYSDLAGAPTIPNYTAGTGIAITSNVISTTGLTAVALPNVTIAENAIAVISAGWRNITVTCAGVVAGDRIQINPTTAPTGYAIGQAVATATNTLVIQVYAPLLAIGANYSILCKIAAFR